MALYEPSSRPWAGNLMINPRPHRRIAWGRVCVLLLPLIALILGIVLLIAR